MLKSLTSGLEELATDIVELGIDASLAEGILKDVPIVSSVLAVCKTGMHVREHFFIKKVLKFLLELESTSVEEREAFLYDCNRKGYNLCETLIILLDDLDELDKSELVANLFKNYLYGHIDYGMFVRLSIFVRRSLVSDLLFLQENAHIERFDGIEAVCLEGVGLVEQTLFDGGVFGDADYQSPPRYSVNRVGELIIKYVLNVER